MFKVLLADDEYLERYALNIIISEGIKDVSIVGEACCGRQAVELCEKFNPDIIFMDIKMPGMDGIEATKIIKGKNKEKIVIILTAYDEFELAQRALKVKADDYILKPARPQVILDTMRKYMDRIEMVYVISQAEIQSLINNISHGDYNKSREKLNEIFSSIYSQYFKDNKGFKLNVRSVIDGIQYAYDKIGLKTTRIIDSEFDFKISSMNNAFEVRKWLFQILEKIFNEIIDQKICCSNDSLFLAMNYIEKNYQRGITLKDVARYVNLNPSYLSKFFKKELDINISTYITERRINKAKELLENTDMPILNIAVDLSYNESNYFSKVFKKIVGITPSEYRNKKRLEKQSRLKSNLMTKYVHTSNGKWQI
jgi:two-component system response regulator YesN